MEKTILIGEKEVKLSNHIEWMFCYKSQFGHDILPTIMPLAATLIDLTKATFDRIDVSKIIKDGDNAQIEFEDLINVLDADEITDAVIHMSGFELTELVNITWALAKAADENLPEPKIWRRSLDDFPVDKVVPEIAQMIISGSSSLKNLSWLKTPKLRIQPISTSTQSSSAQENEDSGSPT